MQTSHDPRWSKVDIQLYRIGFEKKWVTGVVFLADFLGWGFWQLTLLKSKGLSCNDSKE